MNIYIQWHLSKQIISHIMTSVCKGLDMFISKMSACTFNRNEVNEN